MWMLLTLACAGDPPAPEPTPPAPPRVVGLSFPACWLTERLVADTPIQADCFAPAGEDPPDWQPSGEAVAGLLEAELLVANGMGYEAWLATAALPGSRVVDSAQQVAPLQLSGRSHSHGGEAHTHAGLDPHTWMDPQSFLRQALEVSAALRERWPEHAERVRTNQATLEAELIAVDTELEAATAPLRGLALAASHPAFNYLARRYGLAITSFDLAPEAVDEAGAEAVGAWAEGAEPALLLWESQPSDAARAALPEGVTQLVLDPLEQPPADGGYDWTAQARVNAAVLRAHFSGDRTARGPQPR